VCEPQANKRRPKNPYDARFSLPFALAAALVYGRLTMDEVADHAINDPRVLALCDRTTYRFDPESGFPKHYSGAVEIKLKDGRTLTKREQVNRGSSDKPLGRADIVAKFHTTAGRALPAHKVERVIEDTLALEGAASAKRFASALGMRQPDA
jgi:2-methylcitrate dehydratase PrpD